MCGMRNHRMTSPVRLILLALIAACIAAGGGVLYIDVGNKPMVYYSVTQGFNYRYALEFALGGGLYLGPFLFFIGVWLYGVGYALVFGFRLLLKKLLSHP